MERLPPWEENVHVFKFAPASSSVMPMNALVVVVAEFETVNFHAGVVVPMPTVVVEIEPEPDPTEKTVKSGVPSRRIE